MLTITQKIKRKWSEAGKQLRLLYLNTSLGAFQIAGASWVALLAARGFSLVEIGFAESVFHVASLLFEVPSGVISDVFGRKKSMVLSQCMMLVSSLLMLVSDSMAGVLPAQSVAREEKKVYSIISVEAYPSYSASRPSAFSVS